MSEIVYEYKIFYISYGLYQFVKLIDVVYETFSLINHFLISIFANCISNFLIIKCEESLDYGLKFDVRVFLLAKFEFQ